MNIKTQIINSAAVKLNSFFHSATSYFKQSSASYLEMNKQKICSFIIMRLTNEFKNIFN